MMRLLALAAPFFLAACSLPKEPEFHAPQESEFTVTAGEKSEMAAVGCELTDSRATCTPPTDSDAKVRKDKIDKQLAVVQKVKTEIDNRTSRTLLTAKGLINKISLEASFGVLIPSLGGKSAVADSDIKLELGYQMVVGMNCAGQVGVGSKDAPAFKGKVIYGIHGTSNEEVENIAVASVPDFAGKITASPETSAGQLVKWSSKVGQTRQSVKSDGEFKLSTYSGEKLDVNCFKIRVVKGDGTQFSDRPLADKDVRKITCSVGSLVPDKTKPNGINGGQYFLDLRGGIL